jgi:hypothetical protein
VTSEALPVTHEEFEPNLSARDGAFEEACLIGRRFSAEGVPMNSDVGDRLIE